MNNNIVLSQRQIDLIKNTVAKDTTDDELKLFLYTAQKTGLDPLAKQIHAIKRYSGKEKKETLSIQTGIDGYRLIAERTGKYAGQLGPFWCGKDGLWKDVWLDNSPPVASKVGIIRNDFKEPLWGVARFDAYKQEYFSSETKTKILSPLWFKMPDVMIAKCAEALGLRKAFPQELSGIYTHEEMQQADLQEIPEVNADKILKKQGEVKAIDLAKGKNLKDDGLPFDKEIKKENDDLKISEPQRKRMFALCKESGWAVDSMKALLIDFGFEHSAEVTKEAYESICNMLEKPTPTKYKIETKKE